MTVSGCSLLAWQLGILSKNTAIIYFTTPKDCSHKMLILADL